MKYNSNKTTLLLILLLSANSCKQLKEKDRSSELGGSKTPPTPGMKIIKGVPGDDSEYWQMLEQWRTNQSDTVQFMTEINIAADLGPLEFYRPATGWPTVVQFDIIEEQKSTSSTKSNSISGTFSLNPVTMITGLFGLIPPFSLLVDAFSLKRGVSQTSSINFSYTDSYNAFIIASQPLISIYNQKVDAMVLGFPINDLISGDAEKSMGYYKKFAFLCNASASAAKANSRSLETFYEANVGVPLVKFLGISASGSTRQAVSDATSKVESHSFLHRSPLFSLITKGTLPKSAVYSTDADANEEAIEQENFDRIFLSDSEVALKGKNNGKAPGWYQIVDYPNIFKQCEQWKLNAYIDTRKARSMADDDIKRDIKINFLEVSKSSDFIENKLKAESSYREFIKGPFEFITPRIGNTFIDEIKDQFYRPETCNTSSSQYQCRSNEENPAWRRDFYQFYQSSYIANVTERWIGSPDMQEYAAQFLESTSLKVATWKCEVPAQKIKGQCVLKNPTYAPCPIIEGSGKDATIKHNILSEFILDSLERKYYEDVKDIWFTYNSFEFPYHLALPDLADTNLKFYYSKIDQKLQIPFECNGENMCIKKVIDKKSGFLGLGGYTHNFAVCLPKTWDTAQSDDYFNLVRDKYFKGAEFR